MPMPNSGGGAVGLLLDPGREARARVGVVEAEVDRGPRLGGDDVRGAVADVDRGDRERRGAEVRRALVERARGEAVEQAHEAGERVLRPVGIGGVALLAVGGEVRGQRAAAADLHGVAHALGAGRLADEAVVHALAVLGHPVEDRRGAVDAVALLVAGDGDDQAARDGGVSRTKSIAAATQAATPDFMSAAPRPQRRPSAISPRERIVAPGGGVADGHDVDVAVEAEDGTLRPPAGEEVRDAAAVGAHGAEAGAREHTGDEVDRRAGVGGDRRAADERRGEVDGIGHRLPSVCPLLSGGEGRGQSVRRRAGGGCGSLRRGYLWTEDGGKLSGGRAGGARRAAPCRRRPRRGGRPAGRRRRAAPRRGADGWRREGAGRRASGCARRRR